MVRKKEEELPSVVVGTGLSDGVFHYLYYFYQPTEAPRT